MSVFVSPHLGKIRQSSGGVTFTTWKGINVMKAKAESVANPNTIGQQQSRIKFSGVVRYARQILGGLNITLKSAAIRKSAWNAFVGANIQYIEDTTGLFNTSFAQDFVLAKGTLQGLLNSTVQAISPTELELNWSAAGYFPTTSPNDLVSIYAYNTQADTFAFIASTAARNVGNVAVQIPSSWISGSEVFVWIQSTNNSGNASDNQYIGQINLP